jgi:hypothetical protein
MLMTRSGNGMRGDTATIVRPHGTTASGATNGHARMMGSNPDSSERRVDRMGRESGGESLHP